MKALIVEDEPLAARNLKKLIGQYDEDIEIMPVADTIDQGVQALLKSAPDILFLDIELADGSSFEIFKHVDVKCPIIFTTAYDQYALKAFEVNSVAYLLKPITEEKLRQAFSRIDDRKARLDADLIAEIYKNLNKHSRQYKQNFLVKFGRKLVPISQSDVAYFVGEEKYVYLVTQDQKRYLVNYTLAELETVLDPAKFFRLNRQVLVGQRSIKVLEPYFKGQVVVSIEPHAEKQVVSRKQTKLLKEWLAR